MFSNYSSILYPFTVNGKTSEKLLVDITTNLKVRLDSLQNSVLYNYYIIKDGETPESIAYDLYGNEKLFYVIMLVNNKFDWRTDFPLDRNLFSEYIESKYVNPDGIHHYEDTDGNTLNYISKTDDEGNIYLLKSLPDVEENRIYVNEELNEIIPVTNTEYEEKLNNNKRKIQVVNPDFISEFVNELNELLE